MSSHAERDRWRVKVTGLSSDVTVGILCNQFEIASHRINISGKCAFIDGFYNEEEAETFVSEWNQQFRRAHIDMKCQLDGDTNTRSAYESNYSTEYGEDDHSKKKTPCRYGDRCYNDHCPYQHSPERHEEPPRRQDRKIDCRYGSACRDKQFGCPYLHPDQKESKRPVQRRSPSPTEVRDHYEPPRRQDRKIDCKNGSGCRDKQFGCPYLHPDQKESKRPAQRRSPSPIEVHDHYEPPRRQDRKIDCKNGSACRDKQFGCPYLHPDQKESKRPVQRRSPSPTEVRDHYEPPRRQDRKIDCKNGSGCRDKQFGCPYLHPDQKESKRPAQRRSPSPIEVHDHYEPPRRQDRKIDCKNGSACRDKQFGCPYLHPDQKESKRPVQRRSPSPTEVRDHYEPPRRQDRKIDCKNGSGCRDKQFGCPYLHPDQKESKRPAQRRSPSPIEVHDHYEPPRRQDRKIDCKNGSACRDKQFGCPYLHPDQKESKRPVQRRSPSPTEVHDHDDHPQVRSTKYLIIA